VARAASNPGTAFNASEYSSILCPTTTTLANCPAQRLKKSDSPPVALSVSTLCKPDMAVPISLPRSCNSRALMSLRRRDTYCNATILSPTMTSPSSVSGTSKLNISTTYMRTVTALSRLMASSPESN